LKAIQGKWEDSSVCARGKATPPTTITTTTSGSFSASKISCWWLLWLRFDRLDGKLKKRMHGSDSDVEEI
jgi:hypothetical protein